MTRLAVRLEVPSGLIELDLDPGDATLLAGPGADDAVAALIGRAVGSGRGHQIELDGRRLDRRATAARVRAGLGFVSTPAVAADVSIADHLAVIAGPARAGTLLDDAPLLTGRGDEPAGVLSGGERRVLAWLRALALGPRAVVLDRAAVGLDPATLAWAGEAVERWRRGGVAVVVRPGRPEERSWAA